MPSISFCFSGFGCDAVRDWLDESYDAGYWNISTSEGKNIEDLIDDGSIERAGDFHPAFWQFAGGKWNAEKEGANAMFDKLLNDDAYAQRLDICIDSIESVSSIETASTFKETFGEFK